MLGDDDGVLLVLGGPDRPSLLGRGDPATVDRLVAGARRRPGPLDERAARAADRAPARSPRLGPGPVLDLGLALDRRGAAAGRGGGERAPARPRRGRGRRSAPACARPNPEHVRRPGRPGRDRLVGRRRRRCARRCRRRVRARRRRGRPPSWHVHGLGVLPSLRGTGTGDRADGGGHPRGLAAGAAWVSLGMYAQNDGARRLYRRLGFRTDAELTSFSPGRGGASARPDGASPAAWRLRRSPVSDGWRAVGGVELGHAHGARRRPASSGEDHRARSPKRPPEPAQHEPTPARTTTHSAEARQHARSRDGRRRTSARTRDGAAPRTRGDGAAKPTVGGARDPPARAGSADVGRQPWTRAPGASVSG